MEGIFDKIFNQPPQPKYQFKNSECWDIPHLHLTYLYRFNNWFSLGLQVDASAHKSYAYLESTPNSEKIGLYSQVGFLPTARFLYHRFKSLPYVEFYGEMGAGPSLNLFQRKMGSNPMEQKLYCGYAVYVMPFGVSFGGKHFRASVEIGQYWAGVKDEFTAMGSRMINGSVAYRF